MTAEEYLKQKIADFKINDCYPTFIEEMSQIMGEYAEKVIEERTRQELISFLIKRDYPDAKNDEHIATMVNHIIDEYLKDRYTKGDNK